MERERGRERKRERESNCARQCRKPIRRRGMQPNERENDERQNRKGPREKETSLTSISRRRGRVSRGTTIARGRGIGQGRAEESRDPQRTDVLPAT